MKKGILRILALLVALSMMFVFLTSCKSDDDVQSPSKQQAPSSKTDETAEPSEETESEEFIEEGEFEEEYYEDGVVVSRPVYTDEKTSYGTITYGEDEDPVEDLFPEDEDFFPGIGEIDDGTKEEEFIPFVQMFGTKTTGKTREITVDNSAVLFDNFYGFGANVFPTQFTYESQKYSGDVPAYAEINAKRFNEMSGAYARSWFQIDWITTNECAKRGLDPAKIKKWEDNPDYVNYMNNVYDFESDFFRSAVEYWKMLEEADTEIYLAFGWKIGTRVQSWFGLSPRRPDIAAPYDLDKYAEAAAAVFKQCRNVEGLTNFNTLSFYNEPERDESYTYYKASDYSCMGNKCVWWAKMVEKCYKLFKADDELDDVVIRTADCATNMGVRTEEYVNVYLRNHASQYIETFTFHCYPSYYVNSSSTVSGENTYAGLFECTNKAYRFYDGANHSLWITEYYTTGKDIIETYAWDGRFAGWKCSAGAYFVACAHNGFGALFKWVWCGGFLGDPHPTTFDNGTGGTECNWNRAMSEETLDIIFFSYYEESMINNYVRDNSNVHYIEWSGEDIRCAAFTSQDGKDFTLFVETNEGSTDKDLRVRLKKSLGGKTLYVFRFDWNVEKNAQATLIPCSDTIENVTTAFSYHTDDLYGDYIFTTYKPMQSLEVYEPGTDNDRVYSTVKKDGTVSIEPRFVQNVGVSAPVVSSSTIEWEIKRYSNVKEYVGGIEQKIVRRELTPGSDMGSVSVAANGVVTYTPPADAKVGDVVALRASYKADPDRFTSAMIEVVS